MQKLREALQIAKQIAAIQMQEARQRETEAFRQRQIDVARAPEKAQVIPLALAKRVDIHLKAPDGRTAKLLADDEGAQNLLDILNQQGLRAQ